MEKSFLPKKVRQVCARLSFGVLATNIVLSSLVAGLPVFMPVAFAASLTAATGGSSIASSTVGGSWTSLTGPTVTAIDDNDMSASSGVITLTAPSGFEFDTGGTAPTVRVNCTNSCGGGANNNVNNLTNNSTIAVVATSTTLTATITDDVDGGSTENSLTWQNVRVRPTAVTPLASGNIVRSGISFSGVSTSNYGALTETGPTCNGSNGTIVVVNGTIYGGPMNGLAYNNILIGTSGNDVIVSGNGDSYIDGLGGNDTICGGNGSDILNGGDGNDTIFGGNSSDSITGGSGNDTLNGDNSNDVIYGGSGTDNCSGGSGSDDIGGCGGDNEGTEVGSISVTKDASPNSAQDFNFTGSWSFTRDDDSDATLPNNFLVAATDDSTRTVTESVTSGWSLTGLSCTGGGGDSSTDLGTRTATINIDADEEVVCTYTNSQPTTIILEKQTLPDGDTSTFTFTGDLASTTMVDGSQMSSTVTPGTYTTTEVVPEGWKVQSIVCDSGATGNVETATATFTPSAGQTVKCVFTNIKKSHLGFTKTTIGGDGTFAITGDNGAGSFSIDTSDGTGTAGVDMFVDNATTFTFTETLTEEQIAAGWVNHSSACSFTVQPGQSIPNACTFNNTKKAHIHIVKQAVGGDATFGFHGANASGLGSESTFSIDTTSESDSFDVWVDTNVAVDFNITEDTLGGWTPAAGNTCAGSGDEQLQPGEEVECTFTNYKNASLTLQKTSVGGFDTFTIVGIDGSGIGSEHSTDLTTTVENTPVDSTAFTLSFSNSSAQNVNLTEELPANWNFTSATCTVGGSSIEGGVVAALSPGDVATCSFTNTKSVCGNASEENGEECDDENVTGGDGCSETCQLEACGNAVLDTGEECDDGNTEDGDACTNSCDVAACGDAIVYAGTEECDDGNEINTDACTTSCLLPVCGDGYVQSEEECDDGNENDTDTCSNSCEVVFHVPTCDGQTATVYVRDGKVVGGPNDGNTYNAGHTKLKGTSGPDVIVGTESKDKIEGRDGGDVICGLGGNDDIQGNDGADTIYGGDGKDDINGGNGADVIHGGNGKDDLRGGDGSDALCGGAANDDIRGGNGNDRIDAGSGEDDVRGNDNNDLCVNGEDVHSCESTEGTVEECEDEEVGSSSSSSFSSSEGSSSSFSSSEGGEGSSSSSSEAAACSENDLYAHWTFEEGVGATTDDVVGIHDGNLQNGLGFGAGAPAVDDSTFGLSFDGSDDEVVANSGDTDFSFGNQDFTVSA